jgi:hypothetical protein
VREFPKGQLERVTIAGATIGRGTFEPGWRWSTSVKPIAKTHGSDGADCGPGSVSSLPSGHDAWMVGNVPVVVDFQGMVDYARRR